MAITATPPSVPTPNPDDGEQHAPGDKEMTLLEHLEELRGRLVASVLSVIVGILVALLPVPGYGSITEFIVRLLVNNAPGHRVQALGPGAAFFTFLDVAMISRAALAMQVIVYRVLS